MIIGLDEILTENNKSLFNIEKGKYIYLQDENWYEKEFDTNDEYFVWLFDIENKIDAILETPYQKERDGFMNNLLVSIRRFFKNKNTVTILGVIAVILILFFGYQSLRYVLSYP